MSDGTPPASNCIAYNSHAPGPYGYQPSLAAGVIFVTLYGISSLVHTWQAFHYRTPWLFLFALGAFAETMGWVARLLSHTCPYNIKYFEWQIAVLITGPAFTQAGIYAILWVLTLFMGRHTLPFSPRLYIIVIMNIDTLCFSLQATGGGLAGAAFSKGTDTTRGTNLMVAGIIAQMVSTCIFAGLLSFAIFHGRATIRRVKPLRILSSVALFSVACMITRGVYRSLELLQGWRGYLILHERYTIALDGVTMLLAVVIFNVFNPGRLMAEAKRDSGPSPIGTATRGDFDGTMKLSQWRQIDGSDES